MNDGAASYVMEEAFSVLVGAGFTLGLFLSMAYFELGKAGEAPPLIEDLRPISIPLETPPPSVTRTEPEPGSSTFTGIDVAASESPVRIAVSLPLLENPPVPLAPPAKIQFSALSTEFKPKMDLTNDFDHVFQQSEVDQRPSVLVNTRPFIPPSVRNNADTLRVVLLIVVDSNGAVSNIRVLNSSGNATFDELIGKGVQAEWLFNPAIRKGRKVKCLIQQVITFRWSSSPFET